MVRLSAVAAMIALIVAAAVAITPSPTAAGGPNKFKTTMDGYHEVPAISTTGNGSFIATANAAGDALDFTLTFANLSSSATAAHIHVGAPGTTGAVVAFLCGGGGTPACPAGGGTVTGTIVASSILSVPAQGIAGGDITAIIAAMRAGAAYVNVHSANFPSGEIRGKLGRFHV